jgi:short-subunit dehydrogenase
MQRVRRARTSVRIAATVLRIAFVVANVTFWYDPPAFFEVGAALIGRCRDTFADRGNSPHFSRFKVKPGPLAVRRSSVLDQYAERWALITGASSGIGAEFARRLAGRGMHLVLAARREDILNELAEELHTAHGTEVVVLRTDLSTPDSAAGLVKQVRDRDIEIELLVNNAGYGVVGRIEDTDSVDVRRMLAVNIQAVSDLSYLVLPRMLEQRHGAIINVSSLSGFQPVAYMAAYAASKSWVLHFSEAMWAEVRDRGVTIQALCPGITRTEFFETAGIPNWLEKHSSQSAEKVVKNSLKALEKRRQFVVSGWKNYLLTLAVRLATRRTAVKESMKYFRPKKPNDN